MRTTTIVATLALCLGAGSLQAREIQDGKLVVKPYKDSKYQTEAAVLGKAEFFGYVGDFVADKKITGILLRDGAKANDEQKHVIAITAQTQHIDAFVELDGKVQPLIDPIPPAAAPPPPPPVEEAKPASEGQG